MAPSLVRPRRRLAALLTTALVSSAVLSTPTASAQSAGAGAVSAKGRLVVKEKSGRPARAFVDGVEMGPTPWSGEVTEGTHEVHLRAAGVSTAPEKVTVESGKTHEIEVVAEARTAPVKIGTSDGKGLIYVNGQLVSEGNYVGELPAGTHKLKITREGYDPFEEDLVVKANEPLARTVTLKLSSMITTGTTQESERLEGLYGGFGLLGLFTPGGTGSSIQTTCENRTDAKLGTPNLVSCDAPDGMGAGLGGFVGYSWNPVGIELYAAGSYDQRTLKNDYNATSTFPGAGADPARLEEFRLRRAGGLGLARVRVMWSSKRIRLDFTVGAGLSYRKMFLERVTTAKDGSGLRDAYVSDAPGYLSPVVALEPSVMYRITPGVAVSLGLQMLFESATSALNENAPATAKESNHSLGPLQSLTTPSYTAATGAQIYMGPVLGMMFGP